MDFLLSTFKGVLIGAGAILPGISSGVLCVIFGIYEKLVDSVLGLFKNFKKNATFLFPIVVGVGIGFFLFGSLLNTVFEAYETECKLLFLGLILGSIPSLFKQVNIKKKFRLSYLIYTFISFCFGLFLLMLENKISNSYTSIQNNFIFLLLSGFGMSAGVVIPGISSTVILMCFGTYYIYLESISLLNLSVLIPMGIGLALGSIFFLILIRFFFTNYSYQTYYSIIGFVLGSIFVLIPNSFNFVSIFLFVLGFAIALKLENVKIAN